MKNNNDDKINKDNTSIYETFTAKEIKRLKRFKNKVRLSWHKFILLLTKRKVQKTIKKLLNI